MTGSSQATDDRAGPADPATGRRFPDPRSGYMTALFALLTAMTALSIDMPLPALPRLAEAFGVGAPRVQFVISGFLFGFAAAQLVYGPMSDRFGRRPVLLAGVGLYMAGSVLCLLAQTVDMLIAARVLQGIGACAGPLLVRACVRDLYGGSGSARIMSWVVTGMAFAPVVAPVIGSLVLVAFGWEAVFAVLAGVGVMVFLAVWAFLAETNQHRDPTAIAPGRLVRNFGAVFREPAFVGYTIVLCCLYGALFTHISEISFLLIERFRVPESLFGLYFALIVIGQIPGAILSARITGRLGLSATIRIGLVLSLAAAATLAALAWTDTRSVWAVIAPMTLLMIGFGIVMPNALAGALAPFTRNAGSASSLLGMLQWASAAVMGTVVGLFHDGSVRPMATLIFLQFAVAAIAFFAIARPATRRLESRAAGLPARA